MIREKSWKFNIDEIDVLALKRSDEDWQGVGIYDGEIQFCKIGTNGKVFFDKNDETKQLKDSDTITYGQFKQFMTYFLLLLKEDMESIVEIEHR